jgi:hypothetical protein
MPIIETELATEKPFHEGLTGEIVSAEIVKTPVSGYSGIRVTIKEAGTDEKYAEMLWIRPRTGVKSKLGAFISVLGNNTDTWVGKLIKIVKWTAKEREIQLVKRTKSASP